MRISKFPFNPNNLLRDKYIYGYEPSFSVDAFLHEHDSPLLRYRDDKGRTAAEIIEKACRREDVDQKVILVTLQKEQSLVTRAYEPGSPRYKKALDWAMGYGVPDSARREYKYRGFSKQVKSAAKRLNEYERENRDMIGAPLEVDALLKNRYGKRIVHPVNMATVALYRYTPWVGDRDFKNTKAPYGNLLFHEIWSGWFGDPHL